MVTRPDTFAATCWACCRICDPEETVVGLYDTRRLTFTPVAHYPRIHFSTRQVWVDANVERLQVSYGGHLLRMPPRPANAHRR